MRRPTRPGRMVRGALLALICGVATGAAAQEAAMAGSADAGDRVSAARVVLIT